MPTPPTPTLSLLVSAIKTALKGADGCTLSRSELRAEVKPQLTEHCGSSADKAARKEALAAALGQLQERGRVTVEGAVVQWLQRGEKRAPDASIAEDEQEGPGDTAEAVGVAKKKAKTASFDAATTATEDACSNLKVHVSGLPFTTTEATLWTDFGKCGQINELALLKDQSGRSRGIAFITFESKKGVAASLKLDGEDYNGRSISVSIAKGGGERPSKSTSKGDAKSRAKGQGKGRGGELELFIGGLPYKATELGVKSFFEKCGKIDRFDMPMNRGGNRGGTCKGIAWITFKAYSGVEKALELHKTEYEGRPLVVERRGDTEAKGKTRHTDAMDVEVEVGEGADAGADVVALCGDFKRGTCERGDRCKFSHGAAGGGGKGTDKGKDKGSGKGKSKDRLGREFEVFVGGLPWAIEEALVRKDFEECGEIARLAMPLDDEGKTKGIAFINYRTKEAMEKALSFHEQEYGGLTIRVLKANAPRSSGVRAEDEEAKSRGKGKDQDEKPSSASYKNSMGCIVESTGKKQTFDESDEDA